MARFIVDIANLTEKQIAEWTEKTLDHSQVMNIHLIDETNDGAFYEQGDVKVNILTENQIGRANYELSERKRQFEDNPGHELKVGDMVILKQVDSDMEFTKGEELFKGDRLYVTELLDVESNCMEFKSDRGLLYTMYGHRVLKLN